MKYLDKYKRVIIFDSFLVLALAIVCECRCKDSLKDLPLFKNEILEHSLNDLISRTEESFPPKRLLFIEVFVSKDSTIHIHGSESLVGEYLQDVCDVGYIDKRHQTLHLVYERDVAIHKIVNIDLHQWKTSAVVSHYNKEACAYANYLVFKMRKDGSVELLERYDLPKYEADPWIDYK